MNVIDDYMLEELLDDLKRIESDLSCSTIYTSTIKTAKILVANLEYCYEEAKKNEKKN